MAIDASACCRLASPKRLRLVFFSAALALVGACGDPDATHRDNWSPLVADAGLSAATGGGTGAALAGGGTLGGAMTGGGLPGGGTTGGGLPGGGTTGGVGTPGTGLPGGLTGGGTPGGGSSDAGVSPDAGTAGGGAGFPRSGEALNVELVGPYQGAEYEGPPNPVFASSTIFYPTNAVPPFAMVAISPGFDNNKENLRWWGPVLASHGFVAAILSPTQPVDFPSARADDLEACIAMLASEHTRPESPLMGKLESSRAGLLGHSMGGGAVLLVQARAGTRYKAAVAWEPWGSTTTLNTSTIASPTLIVAAEKDFTASPRDAAWPFYQLIPASATKAYAELAGVDHFGASDMAEGADAHPLHAKWTIAWLKLHLEDDARYDVYIQNGPELTRFGRAP